MIKSWNVENVETAQRDVSIILSFPVTTPNLYRISVPAPIILTPAKC